jgi:hypothetical protein
MARAALRKKASPAPVAPVTARPGFLGTLPGDVYQLGVEVGSGGEGIIRAVARREGLR